MRLSCLLHPLPSANMLFRGLEALMVSNRRQRVALRRQRPALCAADVCEEDAIFQGPRKEGELIDRAT